jgi:hypothetical protein
MKRTLPPRVRNTPSVIPQRRHPSSGRFLPKNPVPRRGIYRPQQIPTMLSASNGVIGES